jgi:hypothetical protein
MGIEEQAFCLDIAPQAGGVEQPTDKIFPTCREYLPVESGSRPLPFGLEIDARVKTLLVSVRFPNRDKENHRCDADMTDDIRWHGLMREIVAWGSESQIRRFGIRPGRKLQ